MLNETRVRVKGDSHQIWRTQRAAEHRELQNTESCRTQRAAEHREYKETWQAYDCFFGLPRGRTAHSSPNRLAASVTQFRIAEGPTAIDAATQRRYFVFRLRLVDKLQPIGGGSGRGHPLSGTAETWMAPDVMPTK
jgi:hypothetical protein